MKKLVIAAGTGFLGNVLINHFKDTTNEIVVLTRGKARTTGRIKYVNWDARTLTGWENEFEGADVVINLAGKSVDCRYTPKNKAEILSSRVNSTRILGEAILNCNRPPLHWLNSSTATIYRHSEDKQMDEETGEIGSNFSMDVAKAWEKAFFESVTPRTKKTALRTSIVLGSEGGAFVPLKRIAQTGFGGRQGNGRQFVSWIHEKDFARSVEFIIENQIEGHVNLVSPAPIRNSAFMKMLRHKVNMPFGFGIPETLLKLGAALIGTETELVLKSRNVIPARLVKEGFKFSYPTLDDAVKNL
ncbi:MAG: TIGR01777 family protein [Flavobacterium sp.]|nr:MAG: TIGR01777 family protein [Flavobacterium sp.]